MRGWDRKRFNSKHIRRHYRWKKSRVDSIREAYKEFTNKSTVQEFVFDHKDVYLWKSLHGPYIDSPIRENLTILKECRSYEELFDRLV
jgi:hypothetical protein